MSSDILEVADLFVKNNSWRNNKKRQCFHSSSKEEIESDFVQFNKHLKMIPQKDHQGLVVVVINMMAVHWTLVCQGKYIHN